MCVCAVLLVRWGLYHLMRFFVIDSRMPRVMGEPIFIPTWVSKGSANLREPVPHHPRTKTSCFSCTFSGSSVCVRGVELVIKVAQLP